MNSNSPLNPLSSPVDLDPIFGFLLDQDSTDWLDDADLTAEATFVVKLCVHLSGKSSMEIYDSIIIFALNRRDDDRASDALEQIAIDAANRNDG